MMKNGKQTQSQKPLEHTFEKLDDREFIFRQIVAHLNDAVVIVDRENRVKSANLAAEKLFGVPLDKFVGKKFGFKVHSGKPGFRAIPYQRVKVKKPDGTLSIVELNITEIKLHGDIYFLIHCKDITELVELRQKKEETPLFDSLTNLYNRRGFTTLVSYQMKMSERTKRGIWMVVVSIDNLAKIYSLLGKKYGEKALKETAEILQGAFRASDVIGYLGNGEFAVAAIGAAKNSGEILRKRIENVIDARNENLQREYKLIISIGMAYFDPENPKSVDELLMFARTSMVV